MRKYETLEQYQTLFMNEQQAFNTCSILFGCIYKYV